MVSRNVSVMTLMLVDAVSKKMKKIDFNVSKGFKSITSKIQKATKAIRPFFAAVTGIGALAGGIFILGKAFKIAMDNTIEAIDAAAKLEGILQTTGNAAGITAGQMGEMANQMASVTTFSRTAITNAQALGATFTKIGGEIFPRAIHSALDMSAVFGQTLQQSMIQLGTALNDPIRGVGRLMRIGVSFSLQQKNMIEDFMMMGDVASAQAVIIEELETEFGSAAESLAGTFVGAVRQSSAAIADFTGNIGLILSKVPRLLEGVQAIRDKILNFTTGDLIGLTQGVFKFFRKVGGGFLMALGIVMNLLKPVTFVISALITAIVGGIELVARLVIGAVSLIVGVWHTAAGLIENVWFLLTTDIWNYFRGVINLIVDGINALVHEMNKIPGVNVGMVGKLEMISTTGDDLKRAERQAKADFAAEQYKELDGMLAGVGAKTWEKLTDFFGVFDDNLEKQGEFLEQMLKDEQEIIAVLRAGEELDNEQKEKLEEIASILEGPNFRSLRNIAGFFNRLEQAVGDLNQFFRDIGIGLADDQSQTEKVGKALTDMIDIKLSKDIAADIEKDMQDFFSEGFGEDVSDVLKKEASELGTKVASGIGSLVGGFIGGSLFNLLFRKKKAPEAEKPVPVKVVNWGDMTAELLKVSTRRAVSPMITSPGNSMMSSDFSRDTRF